MRGGHNVKPKAEHEAKGNFRPSRHDNRAESAVKLLDTIPKAPKGLSKREADKWAEVCQKIFTLGILTDNDFDLIEVYVTTWFIWQDAAIDIRKNGQIIASGEREVKNPSLIVMAEAWKTIKEIAGLFGFSPRSRMGIKTEPKKPVDPLDGFNKN